jgi:hypothetical protein
MLIFNVMSILCIDLSQIIQENFNECFFLPLDAPTHTWSSYVGLYDYLVMQD